MTTKTASRRHSAWNNVLEAFYSLRENAKHGLNSLSYDRVKDIRELLV